MTINDVLAAIAALGFISLGFIAGSWWKGTR